MIYSIFVELLIIKNCKMITEGNSMKKMLIVVLTLSCLMSPCFSMKYARKHAILKKLSIVRHGETDWNKSPKKVQGQSDILLNEKGRQQAHQLRDFLRKNNIDFNVCISSDLSRAVETAQIIKGDSSFICICDSRLRERSCGDLEGRLWSEYTKLTSEEKRCVEESDEAMGKRIFECLGDIQKKYIESGSNTLVVTHGGVIKNILTTLLDLGLDYEIAVQNMAMLTLVYNGQWIITGLQGITLLSESDKGTDTFSIKK